MRQGGSGAPLLGSRTPFLEPLTAPGVPKTPSKIQAKVMMALQPSFVVPDVASNLVTKLKVTLSADLFDSISDTFIDFQWLTTLIHIMQEVKIHCRMVWWKTVCGAWTTSHRMHEADQLPCVFGCTDAKDTLCHYLICPVLWQLAREVCPLEVSSDLPSRLCLVSPSKDSLNRLSIAFGIFHAVKNDMQCSFSSATASTPSFVQARAVGFARSVASVIH